MVILFLYYAPNVLFILTRTPKIQHFSFIHLVFSIFFFSFMFIRIAILFLTEVERKS